MIAADVKQGEEVAVGRQVDVSCQKQGPTRNKINLESKNQMGNMTYILYGTELYQEG